MALDTSVKKEVERFRNLNLDKKNTLEDYAAKFAEILGGHHYDELLRFFNDLNQKVEGGLENHVRNLELPGTASKDPPFKLTLSDGTKIWVKVRNYSEASKTYMLNKYLRECHEQLADGFVNSPMEPFKAGEKALVFYVDINKEKKEGLMANFSNAVKTLAYMHFYGKIFSSYMPVLIQRTHIKSSEEIEHAFLEINEIPKARVREIKSRYESAVHSVFSDWSDDLTIIHGDMHRENIKNGVIIDDESLSLGHPYFDLSNLLWDVYQGKTESENSVREYFNQYLDVCKNLEGRKMTGRDEEEWRESEWQKFKFISYNIEMPWRVARVWKYEHLAQTPWRTEQREMLTTIIRENVSSRN